MLTRIKKKLGLVRYKAGPPAWRTVEAGPLAGAAFFVPSTGSLWTERLMRGEFEKPQMDRLAELASGGGVLYDIGGHVGVYAVAWCKNGGDRVEVFEPLPSNAAIIRETLERNEVAHQVVIHEIALSDAEGTATLSADESDLGGSSMAHLAGFGLTGGEGAAVYNRSRHLNVPTRTLDGMSDLPPPRVMKLDVEGAEGAVLTGARQRLEVHQPIVLAEIHRIDAGLVVAELMSRLGFSYRVIEERNGQVAAEWSVAS